MRKEHYGKFARILVLVLIISAVAFSCASCNYQIVDTTYKYTYVRIYKPDGTIFVEGPVDSWKDYSDGDQLQVKVHGVTYLTHASLMILSTE